MSTFFGALFAEVGARRRRLRAALGDRGQALVEFLVLAGLAIGSLGLLTRTWMPDAAPWGFFVPAVFLVGYFLIEARRQATAARSQDAAKVSSSYDWLVLLWSLGCALLGAAAFVIAYSAQPAPPPEQEVWTPPEGSVSVDIAP
ncbi:MAG: hypothetical protein K2P58_02430 [Hyphomonadaceae bacterium]|nr:hypothetical protein [Hyphomonadaceae bacterium]